MEKVGTGERYATKDVPDGFDKVRMRVAPWMMFGSLGLHDTLYSSEYYSPLVEGNTAAAQAANVGYTPYADTASQPGGWTDIWTEDFFQTGWTGFPGPNGTVQGMRIYNPRPWGRPPQNSSPEVVKDYHPTRWIWGNPEKNRPASGLGPDKGAAEFYNPKQFQTGNTQDSHGNHDLVPPHKDYKMGRIYVGNKALASTMDFYTAQGVQGPPIVADTTWLAVEHVDEYFHFVPAKNALGWKLLVASPALMTKMLEDLKAKGHGAAVLHQGLPSGGGDFEKSVDETLADTQLSQWSQVADTKIQGHIDQMKAETGLTDADIIESPDLVRGSRGEREGGVERGHREHAHAGQRRGHRQALRARHRRQRSLRGLHSPAARGADEPARLRRPRAEGLLHRQLGLSRVAG
ncbi:MAG: hypothetical protein IPM35_28460 [Myxococcales bacterium]|nr:hypothetical protein [Myxococcales bacterium]